jgi:hypothetical protein
MKNIAQLLIVAAIIIVIGIFILATLSVQLVYMRVSTYSTPLCYEEIRTKFGTVLNLSAHNESILGTTPEPHTTAKITTAFEFTEASFVKIVNMIFYATLVNVNTNAAGTEGYVNVTLYLTNHRDTIYETVFYLVD